jgi:hypothetical protein
MVLAEKILSVEFQMGSKPPTIPKRSLCADNLFELGKLLQGAREYLSRCQETLEYEQGQMVELACEQIPQLKQIVETLDRKLKELEGQVRKNGSSLRRPATGSNKRNRRSAKKVRNRVGVIAGE